MTAVFYYLAKGGITMIPLIICSVIGLGIILEKTFGLRKKKILIPEIISVINSIQGVEDIKMATNMCEKYSGPFANIILTGLQNRSLAKENIKEMMVEQGRQEVAELERGLNTLEIVASVSPLLGLLGTVIGMIKVFTVISTQGMGQANLLAGGISEALITTVTGLIIAIPALVAHKHFTKRAERYILDIEKYSTLLFRKLQILQDKVQVPNINECPL